jgi:hypothetical protein
MGSSALPPATDYGLDPLLLWLCVVCGQYAPLSRTDFSRLTECINATVRTPRRLAEGRQSVNFQFSAITWYCMDRRVGRCGTVQMSAFYTGGGKSTMRTGSPHNLLYPTRAAQIGVLGYRRQSVSVQDAGSAFARRCALFIKCCQCNKMSRYSNVRVPLETLAQDLRADTILGTAVDLQTCDERKRTIAGWIHLLIGRSPLLTEVLKPPVDDELKPGGSRCTCAFEHSSW